MKRNVSKVKRYYSESKRKTFLFTACFDSIPLNFIWCTFTSRKSIWCRDRYLSGFNHRINRDEENANSSYYRNTHTHNYFRTSEWMNRIASVVMYKYNKVRNLYASIVCFSVYLYLFFCSIFSRRLRRLHEQTSRQTFENFYDFRVSAFCVIKCSLINKYALLLSIVLVRFFCLFIYQCL